MLESVSPPNISLDRGFTGCALPKDSPTTFEATVDAGAPKSDPYLGPNDPEWFARSGQEGGFQGTDANADVGRFSKSHALPEEGSRGGLSLLWDRVFGGTKGSIAGATR